LENTLESLRKNFKGGHWQSAVLDIAKRDG